MITIISKEFDKYRFKNEFILQNKNEIIKNITDYITYEANGDKDIINKYLDLLEAHTGFLKEEIEAAKTVEDNQYIINQIDDNIKMNL